MTRQLGTGTRQSGARDVLRFPVRVRTGVIGYVGTARRARCRGSLVPGSRFLVPSLSSLVRP